MIFDSKISAKVPCWTLSNALISGGWNSGGGGVREAGKKEHTKLYMCLFSCFL